MTHLITSKRTELIDIIFSDLSSVQRRYISGNRSFSELVSRSSFLWSGYWKGIKLIFFLLNVLAQLRLSILTLCLQTTVGLFVAGLRIISFVRVIPWNILAIIVGRETLHASKIADIENARTAPVMGFPVECRSFPALAWMLFLKMKPVSAFSSKRHRMRLISYPVSYRQLSPGSDFW